MKINYEIDKQDLYLFIYTKSFLFIITKQKKNVL